MDQAARAPGGALSPGRWRRRLARRRGPFERRRRFAGPGFAAQGPRAPKWDARQTGATLPMSSAAIVARNTVHGLAYLRRTAGRSDWARAESDADTYHTVREATRAALRLPGRL